MSRFQLSRRCKRCNCFTVVHEIAGVGPCQSRVHCCQTQPAWVHPQFISDTSVLFVSFTQFLFDVYCVLVVSFLTVHFRHFRSQRVIFVSYFRRIGGSHCVIFNSSFPTLLFSTCHFHELFSTSNLISSCLFQQFVFDTSVLNVSFS